MEWMGILKALAATLLAAGMMYGIWQTGMALGRANTLAAWRRILTSSSQRMYSRGNKAVVLLSTNGTWTVQQLTYNLATCSQTVDSTHIHADRLAALNHYHTLVQALT